jgi:Flp pilus assembly protein TadG
LLADNRPRLEDLSMPSFAVAAVSVRNAVKRLRRNRRGSVAVEFAFIAPIFFALLFAIIETGMVFFAGQVLETGVQDSARLMFTHQAQDGGMSEFDFKTDLCNRIKTLFNCAGDPMSLNVDVTLFAPGTSISLTDPIVSGNLTGPFAYQLPPAGTASTVVVRVFYQWPLFVTGLGYNIANLNGSQRLLAATAAFHVEP